VLKGVNRCLEKVKTSEQPRWLCCPCKQYSLFIDLRFAELAGEPVEALVKSMALHGTGGLDVPPSVSQVLQA